MKPKRRYIAFEVVGAKVSRGNIIQMLNRLSSGLPQGPAQDRGPLRLILYETSSGRGLLKCGHKQAGDVKAAMARIKKIGEYRASLVILGVSGTIRAARRKFLARQAKG